MKKNKIDPRHGTLVMGIMLTLGFFVFFDPFGWLIPKGYLRPPVSQEKIQLYGRHIEDHGVPGDEFLVRQIRNAPLVFLSEMGAIADEPEFLAENLATLVQEGGLTTLAVYFLLAEDQEKINTLLSKRDFDEKLATELLFNRSVLWGYREYRDILESAHWVYQNSTTTFRVLGLAIRQDFSQLTSEADFRDPEKLRTIMNNGIPDREMAQTLIRYFSAHGESRTLVYILREQGFPRIDLPLYTEQLEALGFPGEYQFARIIHRAGFTNHRSISFHTPWPSNQTRNRSEYPASGTIDAALDFREKSGQTIPYPIGFPLDGPFDDVIILRSVFNYQFPDEGPDVLRLNNLMDGTIVLDRLNRLSTATLIDDFITDGNIEQAIHLFPGPRPGGTSPREFRRFIQDLSENRIKVSKELD